MRRHLGDRRLETPPRFLSTTTPLRLSLVCPHAWPKTTTSSVSQHVLRTPRHRVRHPSHRLAASSSTDGHVRGVLLRRIPPHFSVLDSWLSNAPLHSRTALVDPRPPFDPASLTVTWAHPRVLVRGEGRRKIAMKSGASSISFGKRS